MEFPMWVIMDKESKKQLCNENPTTKEIIPLLFPTQEDANKYIEDWVFQQSPMIPTLVTVSNIECRDLVICFDEDDHIIVRGFKDYLREEGLMALTVDQERRTRELRNMFAKLMGKLFGEVVPMMHVTIEIGETSVLLKYNNFTYRFLHAPSEDGLVECERSLKKDLTKAGL